MLTILTRSSTVSGCAVVLPGGSAVGARKARGAGPPPMGKNRRLRPRLSTSDTASMGILPPPMGCTARKLLLMAASWSLTTKLENET